MSDPLPDDRGTESRPLLPLILALLPTASAELPSFDVPLPGETTDEVQPMISAARK